MRLKILQRLAIFVVLSGLVMWSCKDDPDKTAPKITLLGPSSIVLPLQGTYEEPGYIAEDDRDGDITSSVIAPVPDMNTVGIQELIYSVADKGGNADTAIRVVKVYNSSEYLGGPINAQLVDPYPGTAPLEYDEELVIDENEENVVTVVNFANSPGANVKIRLNRDGAKNGTVDFVSGDLTMIEGAHSSTTIKVHYEKANGDEAVLLLTHK